MKNEKSKVVAALLAWFLGIYGAHRYYLGYKKRGAVMTAGGICLLAGYGILGGMGYSTIDRIANGYSVGAGRTIGALFALCLIIFGCVTSIMALVDFIRILCNKLLPADGSGFSTNNGDTYAVALSKPAVAQPAQYIIDSLAAVPAIYRYHEMLEKQILTQEEFDAKKKQLLGL